MNIIGMNKAGLLVLEPAKVDRLLIEQEMVYIATTLGSFWQFDYEAAKKGKVGMHAILKSERHSDGFFISKILLEPQNIRMIMANQQFLRLSQLEMPQPGWVAGIPDGATQLGIEVAKLVGAKTAEMCKKNGRIRMISEIPANELLLWVEDFSTAGTGLTEAVTDLSAQQPQVKMLPCYLVLINRGGLKEITIKGVGTFLIVPVVDHRVNDWPSSECPLCKMGSVPIKSKASDENWQKITTSQL